MSWLRLFFWLILFASSLAQAEVAVPELKARVNDLTQTLSASEVAQLETKLAQLEQAKGSQVAVLIVPTTQPETIEQFGIRVVDQWKLGRKGVDDGVLLLVAKEDRTVRIEVGYGLEGAIPDAIANRVINEYIVPAFKQGDFFGGIDQAVQKIIGLIQGEPLPEPQPDQTNFNDSWLPLLIIAVVVVGSVLRMIFGRMVGASAAAGLAGAAGMALGGLFMGLIVGLIVFVFVVSDSRGRGGYGGRSGGFGGGGFGGGGFSGGGGGFGGGGASGRW